MQSIITQAIMQYRNTIDPEEKSRIVEKAYKCMLPKIKTWANRSKRIQQMINGDEEDLISESFFIFEKAMRNYSCAPAKFSTYFWNSIQKWCSGRITSSKTIKRVVSYYQIDTGDLHDWEDHEKADSLHRSRSFDSNIDFEIKCLLPEGKEKSFLEMVLRGYSLKEIPSLIGIKKSEINTIRKKLQQNKEIREIFEESGYLKVDRSCRL